MTDSEFFAGFVYGEENRSCIQTLRNFADGTHRNPEPVLLMGSSGTGKTHLLRALYRRLLDKHTNRILYQTGEALINNILHRIWEEDERYLSHYMDLNMLLIDDLSSLNGKHSTQQEVILFLENIRKCSVPTLCGMPDDFIVTEPIVTCFPGTVLRLVPPSNDTVRRLVELKASQYNVTAPDEKVNRAAAAARGNGFIIEGALKRCAFQSAFASIYN